jgi:CheY-like chemotaxis protein
MQTIRKSGAAHANIPIVVVTASAMKGMQEKFMEMGADAYVSKPVDLKQLQAAVVKVMTFAARHAA